MSGKSRTHLVVIPSYNSGLLLGSTVEGALARWEDVWVAVDGSTDGSEGVLAEMERTRDGLRVLRFPVNRGKGATVLSAAEAALRAGFTHILTMDSDGQHRAADIPEMMKLSQIHPDAVIFGKPVFDDSAPAARVMGREISNVLARAQTCFADIGDCLFGFRVYPAAPLVAAMKSTRWARRFDFDPEVAVRMVWRGATPVNFPSPVRYPAKDEGGISQFRYLRDNALLSWMHTRLILGALLRYPALMARRVRKSPPYERE